MSPLCLRLILRPLALAASLCSAAFAQTPPAPASLVHDETRFFPDARRVEFSEKLMTVQRKSGVKVFLAAMTYTGDATVRETAARLAAAWSANDAALVLAHDRGKGQSGAAVSAEFWKRYPADEVVTLLGEIGKVLVKKDATAEQNMAEAVATLIPRLTKMESARARRQQAFTRQDLRLGFAVGCGLVALLPVAFLLLRWSGRRRAARMTKHRFPDVDVATRLGAPFGGGVVAEAGPEQ